MSYGLSMRNKILGVYYRRLMACGFLGLMFLPGGLLADGVQPHVFTLPNGLKFICVERHEQPTVAAGVFYKVGSVNDPHGQSGIAHLFEHMLFKGSQIVGTSDYEAEKKYLAEIDQLREKMNAEMDKMRVMKRLGKLGDVLDPSQWTPQYAEMKKKEDELVAAQRQYIKNNELFNLYTTNGGAGLNAGTAEDVTLYYVQLPSNKLELFFWLEADRMVNGIMREFYVERDNVREERRLRTESTPTGKLDELFESMFWQAHPYGIPVIGWASEVESITAQDVRDFYKIYYAPNNATAILVGDFNTQAVEEMANRYFGNVPRGASEPPAVITEEPTPLGVRRFDGEAETNPEIRVRFHAVAMGHPDEAALQVLSGLLSGKTGRLYKRLVTKEEIAIGSPDASMEARKYAGYFEATATIKEGKNPEDAEQMILQEIAALRDGEITDLELQKVKNQVLASSVRQLRTNMGLMFQLGVYETWYQWDYINDSPAQMLKVTSDDVKRVIKTYLDPAARTVAIYRTKGGTSGEDPELAAVLASIPAEQQGMVKAMLKQIAELPLDKVQVQLQTLQTAMSSGQVPDEDKPVMEFIVKKLKAREEALKTPTEGQ